jgi:hypothetical protein
MTITYTTFDIQGFDIIISKNTEGTIWDGEPRNEIGLYGTTTGIVYKLDATQINSASTVLHDPGIYVNNNQSSNEYPYVYSRARGHFFSGYHVGWNVGKDPKEKVGSLYLVNTSFRPGSQLAVEINDKTTVIQFGNDNVTIMGPTMTITSSTVTNGETSNDDSILLTFTSSEATTDFLSGDISVSNGSISDFNSVSATEYTATFTPTASGACSINVDAGAFTDASDNGNEASQFTWTFDNISPVAYITEPYVDPFSDNLFPVVSFYTNEDGILTTNLSEGFLNGEETIQILTADGTGHSVNFARLEPKTYSGVTITLTDPSGNATTMALDDFTIRNKYQKELHNDGLDDTFLTSLTNLFSSATNSSNNRKTIERINDNTNQTLDTIKNTIQNSSSVSVSQKRKVRQNIIKSLFEESSTIKSIVFPKTDLDLSTKFRKEKAVVFRPGEEVKLNGTDSDLQNDEGFYVTLEDNENIHFAMGDRRITFTRKDNGTEERYQMSYDNIGSDSITIQDKPTDYNDINNDFLIPSTDTDTDTSITLQVGSTSQIFLISSVGDGGSAPTMTITSSTVTDDQTSNDTSILLTFTSSEATTNFLSGDISVTNGTISEFTVISETEYTAKFTPTDDGACTINVAAGSFTDASGNANLSSNTFTWTFEASSAGAGGDPYVITLDNRLYKLPNFDGFARMLEGNYNNKKFIINASCKIASQQSMDDTSNYITNRAKGFKEYSNQILNINYHNSKNESFFDKIFIQCDNQTLLYDLDKMEVIENNSNFEISNIFNNNNSSFVDLDLFNHYKYVKGTKGKELNVKIKVGDINLILSNNSNPQFRTSFRIDNVHLIKEPKGALVNKLYYKDFKIKKISNNKKIIKKITDRTPRRIQKEKYYQKISNIVNTNVKDIEVF